MIYQKYVMCLFNKIDIKRTLILNFLSIFLYNYFIDPKECNSLQKRSQCLFVGLTVLTKSRESHLHPFRKWRPYISKKMCYLKCVHVIFRLATSQTVLIEEHIQRNVNSNFSFVNCGDFTLLKQCFMNTRNSLSSFWWNSLDLHESNEPWLRSNNPIWLTTGDAT